MRKVIVFGTFDTIHPGHIFLLRQAKRYGDYLVVVVARDYTVCKIKGREPRFNEKIRLKNVQKLGIAEKSRLGCIDDEYKAIREEKPDVVALGYDQKVFVDNVAQAVGENCQIVRIPPYMDNIYKSSKIFP